jgi:protein TonB
MRTSSLAGLALGLLLAGAAVAAPPAVEEAKLAANPSDVDLMNAYPEKARGQSLDGQVTLRCTIDAAGKAQRCETLKEDPYGLGFGEAGARLLEAKGRFKPRRIDGQAVDGGQVEVSLHIWPHASRGSLARGNTMRLDDPVWAAAPSFEDMAAAWPAGQPGAEAVVVLRCRMRPAGELERCRTINGADKAAADAALALSDRFRVRLTREEARFHAGWDVIVSLRLLNPAGPAAGERQVTAPDWTAYPDEKALQAAYPAQAAGAGLRSGRGIADCLVAADGSLTDCRTAGERPDGAGFGAASAQVAGQMKLNLWSADGRPTVGARIRLPIEFNPAK